MRRHGKMCACFLQMRNKNIGLVVGHLDGRTYSRLVDLPQLGYSSANSSTVKSMRLTFSTFHIHTQRGGREKRKFALTKFTAAFSPNKLPPSIFVRNSFIFMSFTFSVLCFPFTSLFRCIRVYYVCVVFSNTPICSHGVYVLFSNQ